MKNLTITHQPFDKSDILILNGSLDLGTYPQFEEQIKNLLVKRSPKIIIHCQELIYISSSGLGGFIDVVRRVKLYNGEVEFVNFNPKTLEIVQLLGFDKVLTIK